MIDWGVITTAVGAVIGGILTGLATWKTMSSEAHNDLDTAQAKFMDRLFSEIEDLRERIDKLQKTIDVLIDENHDLKKASTEKDIKIANQDDEIYNLKK